MVRRRGEVEILWDFFLLSTIGFVRYTIIIIIMLKDRCRFESLFSLLISRQIYRHFGLNKLQRLMFFFSSLCLCEEWRCEWFYTIVYECMVWLCIYGYG